MPTLQSAGPCLALQPLEEVLNFELGVPPVLNHRLYKVSDTVWIGGAQTSFPGDMQVLAGNLSFAIFFQPGGWSKLFAVPMREITNRLYDAPLVVGACVRDLWNRLGECSSFQQRVTVVEKFLLGRIPRTTIDDRVASAATYIFNRRGIVSLPGLAHQAGMGLRQFERRFQPETGSSPKVFARVARFQSALDAKLASPKRAWLDIAHSFGYYDQMHMIHDFEILANNSPSQLISVLGDVRPPALADGEM
jgi:AraC-like DNA-binding protein